MLGAGTTTPRALWLLFYNMELCSVDQEILVGTPTNLYVTSDPANKIIYDEAVTEVCQVPCLTALLFEIFSKGKIIIQKDVS